MVLVATQVKRRRGTTAENDAFTGAEGEITVDTEKHELRVHDGQTQGGFVIGAGGSGSGRNIGDIFYTTRKDSGLGGAVECNGGTYSTADYTGAGSIGELLEGGLLDYISLTDYATAISTKGWCDKIGWDGTGTTSFRVPTLTPHIIQKNNIPVVGNDMPIYMKNGLTSPDAKVVSTASYDHTLKISGTGGERANSYFSTDPTKSGIIADTTDTAQLRVMFQLFNGTTDEAVATVGGVLADVAGLKDMSNVTETGKETVVNWCMPDYSAGISVGTSFTASSDGLVIYMLPTVKSGVASVNNVQILVKVTDSSYDYAGLSQMFYVSKGDIVNIPVSGTFYPLKGVN